MGKLSLVLVGVCVVFATLTSIPNRGFQTEADAQQVLATDPGVRGGEPGAGGPVPGLTAAELNLWVEGLRAFSAVETVQDGLGPRFNLDNCLGCHSQPAIGGTSPAVNPQMEMLNKYPHNRRPSFITSDGPAREARFVRDARGRPDGGVAALFTIAGHPDASGCNIEQPDFEEELARNNVIFRIATPVFGAGLIEAIPDSRITANQNASLSEKRALGIGGRPGRTKTITGSPNRNGNDGTITRFGWKAQNKSLVTFSGEAYNVEMGVSNDVFPTERDETTSCQFARVPNDTLGVTNAGITISDVNIFAFMMLTHAAPTPVSQFGTVSADSIARGRQIFQQVGCALCHTPTLQTGDAPIEALRNKPAHLFSDLLLHAMGPGLADGVSQGEAAGDEFRTAPLWGLGQRIFFLHDGRTKDLLEAIRAHQSDAGRGYRASEANQVIQRFNALREPQKQDMLNFLRSL